MHSFRARTLKVCAVYLSKSCAFQHQSLLRSILRKEPSGAGEGIRTLDPDLGKVVLYP